MKKQLDMNLNKGKRDERRTNSGRKRIHSQGVAHRKRESINRHTPFHINFKYKLFIRTEHFRTIFNQALSNASHFGFRVTHYNIQTNHIHIIGEADNNFELTRGMKSLTATLVKNIKKGHIQTERYHLHILKTPAECRNAINYVLFNDVKHGQTRLQTFTGGYLPPGSWLLKKSL